MRFQHQPGHRRRRFRGRALWVSFAALVLLGTCVRFAPLSASALESREEMAAMKEVIETFLRSYAEEAMLYEERDQTVCTVSSPEALRLQGGDSVFRISPKKEMSLSALRENIAFVEKKARFYAAMRQMQDIYRENLQLSYTYPVWRQEEDVCHVSVTETAVFYYTDSEMPSVYETPYSIDLVKLGEQWFVADVTDGSKFDGLYKGEPAFDVAAALSELEKNLHTESCTVLNPYGPPPPADGESGWIDYRGADAAAYAYTYSRQNAGTDKDEFYNPQFKSYAGQGGDCQNFVSQCIWAGFGGDQTQASIAENALPMDTDGDNVWYSCGAESEEEDAHGWISCQKFREYLTGTSDAAGTEGSNASDDVGMYATILDVGPGSPVTGVPAESLVGAAAHVEGAGGPYAHAIILTAAVGSSRSEIWFCSHTKDLTHIKLGDYYFTPLKVYIPRYFRTGALPQNPIRVDRPSPAAVSSTLPVGFSVEGAPVDLTVTVTAPGGTESTSLTAENANTCSMEYLFAEAGLYRVDCRAAADTGEEYSRTYYIRCYDPPVQDIPQEASPEAEEEHLPIPPDWLFS